MINNSLKIISGTANEPLAREVAKLLKVDLTPVEIKRFTDGEIYVHIEQSVRGSDVYVIQPTSPDVNQNLMELLLILDALKRSSPTMITAVIPYFGYSRQDRRTIPREPISAKLVADMITKAGAGRVMMFDVHAAQIQGFFDVASDNIEYLPFFAEHILDRRLKNVVAVSPDAGGVANTRQLAKHINAPLAIIDKRRTHAGAKAKVGYIIGEVRDKICILIDDMIDTAGTITEAAKLLKKKGAKQVLVYATHGVFSGKAIARIKASPIQEMVVTNTIEQTREKRARNIKVVSIAQLIRETIRSNHEGRPMGKYFDEIYERIYKKRKKVEDGLIED
ncbi:MAG: hypothetical protein A2826_01360 [Candidatus Doudnabacteria bacterium RIFCSPHIGHO2_01_FULL_43_23]|uniref:Ribose-phosphate pyrophosphokinase n=1 Tax=Candidatus Doudnabacteria bacterium RIFCSPHIGHO2_01_FULL_43_23 TaxID=1817822 RepID=A0A1F5NT74_9BACT|nr:MAG: hypothetical protein A2826_01360 [Candidatus Doudnabacteria bacterium RIFCSPHIGHO2_01_FULL_43_23]